MRKILTSSILLYLLPLVSFAAPVQNDSITFQKIFARLTVIFNSLIPFFALLATVLFIWGVVKYINAGDDEQAVSDARNTIVYGIVALAVMVAVWGLVGVLSSAIFGIDAPDLPGIPGPDLDPFL